MDKLKQKVEEKNELVEQFEASMSEGESGENLDELKAEITKANAEIDNLRFAEKQRADKAVRNGSDGEQKELNKFKFSEAIQYAVNPSAIEADKQGFYAELNKEAEREARNSGVTLGGGGIAIPSKVVNATTAADEYGDIGFDERGSFVEFLNNRSILSQMGAQYMRNLTGNLRFPKETTVPNATWEGETDANAEGTSDFGNVTLSPKRLGTFVQVSQQLTKQTSPDVEMRIQNQLYNALRRGIENAAINGGGTNAPSGIIDVATEVTEADLYEAVVALESQVAQQNADLGSLGYIMNAKTRGLLKTTSKDAGSGKFVMEDNNSLNGYMAGVTNMITEATGTAPNDSNLFFGNFNDLVIGIWGGMELIVDPYSSAKNGLIELVANVYTDVGILHDESFAYNAVETTSA